MPEVGSYAFSHKEVIAALIKQAGLHEGKWQLTMTFGLAATNMGPDEASVVPGAAVAVTGIGLQKAMAASPSSLTVDAAEVNPSST
jgi:hypothetical protein